MDRRAGLESEPGLTRASTAADLDKVVADRPVWLVRVDGHAAVGNSAALEIGAVTASTADPEGGKIERFANNQPTGLFIDNAIDHRKNSKSIGSHAGPVARGGADSLLAYGITATADLGTSVDTWEAYRRAGQASQVRISYAMSNECARWCRTARHRGSTPIDCGWLGSKSIPTACLARWRVAQAASTPTCPVPAACNS